MFDKCGLCGKGITDDEYVVNWGSCSDCFDKGYIIYLLSLEGMSKEMPVTLDNVKEVMSYHAPSPEQLEKLEAIREGAIAFATIILKNAPPCADTSVALRKVCEARKDANGAVVLNGLV